MYACGKCYKSDIVTIEDVLSIVNIVTFLWQTSLNLLLRISSILYGILANTFAIQMYEHWIKLLCTNTETQKAFFTLLSNLHE